MFGYAAFSEVPYSTLPVSGLVYAASISELASAQDAVLVDASTFNANSFESVQGADQSAVVASIFNAQSSEFSTASDSQTAQVVFPVDLFESASASESTVAALVFSHYENIIYEVNGGKNYIGSQDFIDMMENGK